MISKRAKPKKKCQKHELRGVANFRVRVEGKGNREFELCCKLFTELCFIILMRNVSKHWTLYRLS